MVSYASPVKNKQESYTLTNLPWKDIRGLMGRAEKRFVEPLLTGDYSAPAIQDSINQARGETERTTGAMMEKLASTSGLTSPAKAALMNQSMGKINELAAGAGIKTMQQLALWFEKVTGQMAQINSTSSSGGMGGGVMSSYSGPSSSAKTESK